MIKAILPIRDKDLRKKCKEVQKSDKKLKELLRNLEDTLKAQKDPEGVGLSAPQIGVSKQVFIIKKGEKILEFINPKIIWFSSKTNDPKPTKAKKEKSPYFMEGCLSMPNYYGPVQRAWEVKVQYQTCHNNNLETHIKKFSGFTAQIVQHECDHLQGILFIDRLLEQKRHLYHLKNGKWYEISLQI